MDMFNAFAAGEESSSDDGWDMGRQPEKKSRGLIQAGDTDETSLMKRALVLRDTNTVAQLLDKGMDVETRLDFDWTPLMCAVSAANYEMTKLLLDRGARADFSNERQTVLMVCCTATAKENNITACMELLLSRNPDPNMVDRAGMTCLMMAARDGHSAVIDLLMSNGADINKCDHEGFTALSIAVKYNQEQAVLKLLQLGADATIRTSKGRSPADLAVHYRHSKISRILSSLSNAAPVVDLGCQEETLAKFFKQNYSSSTESVTKLDAVELFLNGLELSHLTDIMTEQDITWSYLMTMDKEDLEKIGIRDQLDQQKILTNVKLMSLDKVDLDTIGQLGASNLGTEDLQNFLLSVNQQCCYLTELMRDTISRFPRHNSKLVFTLDPNREAGAACRQLIMQTNDLQKEVTCLHNLLCQMDESRDGGVPGPGSGSGPPCRRSSLSRIALVALGSASFILLLYSAAQGDTHSLLCTSIL